MFINTKNSTVRQGEKGMKESDIENRLRDSMLLGVLAEGITGK